MKLKDYCTCLGKETNNTKFFEVETNSEGICVNCGYYAVSQIDVPNTHGEINYISKTIVLNYLKRYNDSINPVCKILNISEQQLKNILGKKLTKKLTENRF